MLGVISAGSRYEEDKFTKVRPVQQTADNLVKHRSFIGGQRKKET